MTKGCETEAVWAGEELVRAKAALILLHGRGSTAEDILGLAEELALADFAAVAPQAAGGAWYPHGFLESLELNGEGMARGFAVIEGLLDCLARAGFEKRRVFLGGFSQGACLVLEYAARHAADYGGIFGLSGGLIGPRGTPRVYPGSLAGVPLFLGCSDQDPYIPEDRVLETARVMERLGAQVETRLYPGAPHAVNADELARVRTMLENHSRAELA